MKLMDVVFAFGSSMMATDLKVVILNPTAASVGATSVAPQD
jgi:hypothetical protein